MYAFFSFLRRLNGTIIKSILAIYGVIIVLFFTQAAFSSEPAVVLLGDVVGNGNVEIRVASDKWAGLNGKTFPVFAGTHLRTNNGMLSINLRDRVRIEVGRNSNITISGKKGDCSVRVNNGVVGFMVPDGIKFSVITPTMNIEFPNAKSLFQRMDMNAEGNLTGAVVYDGKETKLVPTSETDLALNRTAFINGAMIQIKSIRSNLDSPSLP
jgi:hypothetical protein